MMDDNDPLKAESLDLPSSRELEEAAALLAYAADERTPPPQLKERLMASFHPAAASFIGRRSAFPIAAAALASVLIAVFWARAPRSDATLASAQGVVTVDGRAVSAGSRVGWGSVVAVSPDGEAVVRIGDSAGFSLSRGGSAVLAREDGALVVRLTTGWLLSAVKTGTAYAVVTDHSRISALGTDFVVKVRDGRAYVCICHGRIGLAGDFPEPELASRAHGSSSEPKYEPGGEGGMEGHSDDDIVRLRAAIGLK